MNNFHKYIQHAIKFSKNRIQSQNILMYEKVFEIILFSFISVIK